MGFLAWLFGSRTAPQEPAADTADDLEPVRSFYARVAGVSYNNRQKTLGKCRVGEELNLFREPSDDYPEAIGVYRRNGEQLGFIPADIAIRLADDLGDGVVVTCEIADITGGTKGKPSLGCNIKLTIWE